MSHRLITAFASLLPDGGIPAEIVYLPEGTNKITPFVDGKPQTITVKVPAERRTCQVQRGGKGKRVCWASAAWNQSQALSSLPSSASPSICQTDGTDQDLTLDML